MSQLQAIIEGFLVQLPSVYSNGKRLKVARKRENRLTCVAARSFPSRVHVTCIRRRDRRLAALFMCGHMSLTVISQVKSEVRFFWFDCPAYSSIRASHANLFQCACSVSDFFDSCEANACGGFIRNCFSLSFDWMNINRTLSVGPQLVPRTLNKQTNKHHQLPCLANYLS